MKKEPQMNADERRWRMDAMALEIPDVAGHPNRVPFSGVLTLVDQPSDEPPKGAMGHNVILPRAVAERSLPSLLGMAVNFRVDAQGHDVRRKVGVITEAEVGGGELRVAGHLFAKDFPDVVREIRARKHELGMSYEVTDIELEDDGADVWVLSKLVFTGAAILEKDAAAYKRTSLAATAGKEGDAMEKQEIQKTVMDSIREFFAQFGKKPDAAAVTEEQINERFEKLFAEKSKPLTDKLTALETENKELKAGTSTAAREARRARWNGVVAVASKAGKLVPALVASLAAQAELAIAATGKVKVAEIQADKSTKEVEVDPLDALIAHVEAMPQIVPLTELAGARLSPKGKMLEFTPGPGISLDASSVAVEERAKEIAAELRKQDPKLTEFQAYKEGLRQARAEGAGMGPGSMAAGQA